MGELVPPALASVAAEPPSLATDAVASAVETIFDLRGSYRSLISERDQNFRLTTPVGERYVVKVTGSTESQVVSDFQIEVLLHLQAMGLQGVPRVVRTRSGLSRGRIVSDKGTEYCLRVVTFLDGDLLGDSDVSTALAGSFGQRVAELDRALQNFFHAGENQVLLWDMQRAGELLSLCRHIFDEDIRDQVEAVLRDFKERVQPSLTSLPHQVIHNDANSENVLVDSNAEVSGIIDFGDMLRAPRIVEIATAVSYLPSDDNDPLLLIAAFVSGYQAYNALQTEELDVLFDLIRTRLSMSLTISYWRRAARGENDAYQQKSLSGEQAALRMLLQLNALGRVIFRDRIDHCDLK